MAISIKAFSERLGQTIRDWMRKQIENEQKRQQDAEQAQAALKELHRAFQMSQLQDAKNEVDAYHAHLDEIIRKVEAHTVAKRARDEGI